MAFKLDFSKLDRGPRKPESPYKYTDDMHFARHFKDMPLRKGTVKVGLQQHRLTLALDDLRIPAEAFDTSIELILMGERARDWDQTVHRSLSERRTAMLEAVQDLREADWEAADGVTAEVTVEGYWKKRYFKNRDGRWESILQMHVARFTFEGQEKGRLPVTG